MKLPGLRLSARHNREHRCAFCTDQVADQAARTCVGCGLKLHSDCLEELGPICPTVGCGGMTNGYRGHQRLTPEVDSRGEAKPFTTWQVLGVIAGFGAALGVPISLLLGRGSQGWFSKVLEGAGLGALATLGTVFGAYIALHLLGPYQRRG